MRNCIVDYRGFRPLELWGSSSRCTYSFVLAKFIATHHWIGVFNCSRDGEFEFSYRDSSSVSEVAGLVNLLLNILIAEWHLLSTEVIRCCTCNNCFWMWLNMTKFAFSYQVGQIIGWKQVCLPERRSNTDKVPPDQVTLDFFLRI